jgi:carbonic anhydrase/acetyltransferase-like protein (isoleucine patch superfamily)
MAIYALGGDEPKIHPTAFIHPDCTIIGKVEIGAESSIWPHAVLRGDHGWIRIGDRTSIQDGSVLHVTAEHETVVGSECVVGHLVHLEGCVVADGALVGNASVVLHRAVIGTGAVVGLNAVVTNDTKVPPGALALGVPAKIKEDAADPAMIVDAMEKYVERAKQYRSQLRRLD